MIERATPLLPLLLAACNLCKPTPPPPGPCTSDASCPPGDACLAGSCQSLTQVLQNLTAVVTPLTGNLAPQQIQNIDGTLASQPLTLAAPQLWSFNFPIPPTCTKEEALPITLRFTGQSIVPLLDWTFTFTTDANGNVLGALPADGNEQFAEWIAPATPCAAPISRTDSSSPGPAPVPIFDTSGVLTVVGAISAPGAAVTFGGASVTIKGAQVPFVGQTLSATTLSLATTTAGAPGFVLPVPEVPVLAAAGSSCPPPPINASCDGGACPVLDSCAVLTLEVGPSAQQPDLPTFDLPILGRFAMPADGGGPILSLLGEDGLGVQLPIGPGQLATVTGMVTQPSGESAPLNSAEVSVACVQADGGNLCPQGYSFHQMTLSGLDSSAPGSFTLQVPPGTENEYTLTATPPPGLGFAPWSRSLTVSVAALDGGVTGITLPIQSGYQLTGTILDPTGTTPITAGQVLATSLETGATMGTSALDSADGTFALTLPPGQYMVVVQPDSSTGLPDWSRPESLLGDLDLGRQSLYAAARLGGGVFAASLDGGPSLPVPQASLQFFYITDTEAYGTVALPIASGITDAQGHFSVAVPSSSATAN